MRLFLDQYLSVPNQVVPPRSRGRRRMAVDDREIDPFRLAAPELILQFPLRIGPRRKHDEPGRVAIDAMDDERPALSARSQMEHELGLDRCRIFLPLERYGEQSR